MILGAKNSILLLIIFLGYYIFANNINKLNINENYIAKIQIPKINENLLLDKKNLDEINKKNSFLIKPKKNKLIIEKNVEKKQNKTSVKVKKNQTHETE